MFHRGSQPRRHGKLVQNQSVILSFGQDARILWSKTIRLPCSMAVSSSWTSAKSIAQVRLKAFHILTSSACSIRQRRGQHRRSRYVLGTTDGAQSRLGAPFIESANILFHEERPARYSHSAHVSRTAIFLFQRDARLDVLASFNIRFGLIQIKCPSGVEFGPPVAWV